MSVEVILCRLAEDTLSLMRKRGPGVFLDTEAWAENWSSYLKLDEFILGFLIHELPVQQTLYNAALGGTMFPDSLAREDIPRYYTPDELEKIAQELENVTAGELRARFDGLRDIFGGDALGPEATDDDAFDYLLKRFLEVQEYYREAVRHQEGMLLVMF